MAGHLGYELHFQLTQAYPQVTGDVTSAEIGSGHFTWARLGQEFRLAVSGKVVRGIGSMNR
jgi:hypothetical protein